MYLCCCCCLYHQTATDKGWENYGDEMEIRGWVKGEATVRVLTDMTIDTRR